MPQLLCLTKKKKIFFMSSSFCHVEMSSDIAVLGLLVDEKVNVMLSLVLKIL